MDPMPTGRHNPARDDPIPEYALEWDEAVCRPANLPDAYDSRISPECIFYIPARDEAKPPEASEGQYVVGKPCKFCAYRRAHCSRTRPSCERCQKSGKLCQFPVGLMPFGPRKERQSVTCKRNGNSTSLSQDSQLTSNQVGDRLTNTPSTSATAGTRQLRPRKCKEPRSAPDNVLEDIATETIDSEVQDKPMLKKRRRDEDAPELRSNPKLGQAAPRKRGPRPKGNATAKGKATPQDGNDTSISLSTSIRVGNNGKAVPVEGISIVQKEPMWRVVHPHRGQCMGSPYVASRLGSTSALPRIWGRSKEELCTVIPELAGDVNGVIWKYTETPILLVEGEAWPDDSWDGASGLEISMIRALTGPKSMPESAARVSTNIPTTNPSHPVHVSAASYYIPSIPPQPTIPLTVSAPSFSADSFKNGHLQASLPSSFSSAHPQSSLPDVNLDGLYTLSSSPSPPPIPLPLAPEQQFHSSGVAPWCANVSASYVSMNMASGPTLPSATAQRECQHRKFFADCLVCNRRADGCVPRPSLTDDTSGADGSCHGVHLGVFSFNSAGSQSILQMAGAVQPHAAQARDSYSISNASAIPPREDSGYESASQGRDNNPLHYTSEQSQTLVQDQDPAQSISSQPSPILEPASTRETQSSDVRSSLPQTTAIPPAPHVFPEINASADTTIIDPTAYMNTPPPEIKVLLDCHKMHMPVSIIVCRDSSVIPSGLPAEYGCVFLGFFEIAAVEETVTNVSMLHSDEARYARWRFRFVWTPGGDYIDGPTIGPLPRWWMPPPEADESHDQDVSMVMQPYTLLPREILVSSMFSQGNINGTPDMTASRGWHCDGCGKLNVQHNLRLQKCDHCRRENRMPPVDVACVRNPYTIAPQTLPWNRPCDGLSTSSLKKPDGPRMLTYHFGNFQTATHLFTGNQENLQDEPTQLFRDIQTEVEMPLRGLKTGLGAGPYYTYFAGDEALDDLVVPWTQVPKCLSEARKLMLQRGRLYAVESDLQVNQMTVLAWTNTGSRKGILPAQNSLFTLLCLGADLELSIFVRYEAAPQQGKGKKMAGKRTVSAPASNHAFHSKLDIRATTAAEGSHGPLARQVSSASLKKDAWREVLFVNLVHGDILMLKGYDYQYSMKRTGMNIVLIGTK